MQWLKVLKYYGTTILNRIGLTEAWYSENKTSYYMLEYEE
jgi:hypothetical protein